jgi:hypothetical protein
MPPDPLILKPEDSRSVLWALRKDVRFEKKVAHRLRSKKGLSLSSASEFAPALRCSPRRLRILALTNDALSFFAAKEEFAEKLLGINNWNFCRAHHNPVGKKNLQVERMIAATEDLVRSERRRSQHNQWITSRDQPKQRYAYQTSRAESR